MAARVRRSAWAVLRAELGELVLPQRCVACGAFGGALHPECVDQLPRATGGADSGRCDRCWAPLRGRDGGLEGLCGRCAALPPESVTMVARRAAFRFEGAARRAVLEAKFRGRTSLLGPLASAAAAVVEESWGVEAVVAVPLHPSRRRARGFDQGALIASTVGGALGVPVRADLVRRVRRTRAQASLGRAERARNVEGAFGPAPTRRAVPGSVPGRVLLVDDVVTTGATLEAAARALIGAGVGCVFGLTLAIED